MRTHRKSACRNLISWQRLRVPVLRCSTRLIEESHRAGGRRHALRKGCCDRNGEGDEITDVRWRFRLNADHYVDTRLVHLMGDVILTICPAGVRIVARPYS